MSGCSLHLQRVEPFPVRPAIAAKHIPQNQPSFHSSSSLQRAWLVIGALLPPSGKTAPRHIEMLLGKSVMRLWRPLPVDWEDLLRKEGKGGRSRGKGTGREGGGCAGRRRKLLHSARGFYERLPRLRVSSSPPRPLFTGDTPADVRYGVLRRVIRNWVVKQASFCN